jgi:hypothetical protein
MGIWINILTLGATGQSTAARQQLALALPLGHWFRLMPYALLSQISGHYCWSKS